MLRVQNGNLWLRRERETGVFEVAHNANNCDVRGVRRIFSRRNLQELWGPNVDFAADRIFHWEIAPIEFLANKRRRRAGHAVRISKIPATNQRNPQSPKKMCVRYAKPSERNILYSRGRMPRDIEHLSPSVVWRIDGRYRRLDDARQCSNFLCKFIAEARDRSRVRISHSRQVEMPFQQMVLMDSQPLALQMHDASH